MAGRYDPDVLDHQNDATLGRASAVANATGHGKPLPRLQLDLSVLEIHEERALEHKEELIVIRVMMPVILALHDTQTDYRAIYLTQRLVVPAIRACTHQRRDVDPLELGIQDVQERRIGKGFGLSAHGDLPIGAPQV